MYQNRPVIFKLFVTDDSEDGEDLNKYVPFHEESAQSSGAEFSLATVEEEQECTAEGKMVDTVEMRRLDGYCW